MVFGGVGGRGAVTAGCLSPSRLLNIFPSLAIKATKNSYFSDSLSHAPSCLSPTPIVYADDAPCSCWCSREISPTRGASPPLISKSRRCFALFRLIYLADFKWLILMTRFGVAGFKWLRMESGQYIGNVELVFLFLPRPPISPRSSLTQHIPARK